MTQARIGALAPLGSRALLASLLLLLAGSGCGASKPKTKTGPDRPVGLTADVKGSGGERCDGSKPGREVSEYDTTGDGIPDVRKVYLSIGSGTDARLVVICRETDVNADGKKDVIRYYDDDGRSLREESDRNFDGKMDQAQIFQDGVVVREELDENYDGKIDTKIFYDGGQPQRAERDLAGRSTPTNWRPDRWEYYEDGRMVRMGTDLDGDGRVDRWDRDLDWHSPKDKQEQEEAAAEGTPAQSVDAKNAVAEAAPSSDSSAPAASGSATPASGDASAKASAKTKAKTSVKTAKTAKTEKAAPH